eukprot:6195716-Pleurochrysis_carterae.AAC.1
MRRGPVELSPQDQSARVSLFSSASPRAWLLATMRQRRELGLRSTRPQLPTCEPSAWPRAARAASTAATKHLSVPHR